MALNKKNLNNIFYIFVTTHLIVWTLIPSLTNNNLPLDTIEALAWGSNLDWGFSKHPPMSAFLVEIFYQIFGAQDWAYYLLSQICVIISFFAIFKFAEDFFENKIFCLLSVLLLEGIYFYNFTTPEFNVNVSQLPFWTLTVYFTWKVLKKNEPNFFDLVLLGVFAAVGFYSKYLFLYLLISIDLVLIYFIFVIKKNKFQFTYLISLEVFLLLLIPHLVWLTNNDYVTVTYGLARTGMEGAQIFNHIINPIIFVLKQIGILVPFFVLSVFLIKKFQIKINLNDKKLVFLIFVNIVPIVLVFATLLITGTKFRTMWMTPFYLFVGLFIIYLFKNQINYKNINNFIITFIFLFLFSPFVYAYIAILNDDKRTDYPGKEIANKVQTEWDQNFDQPIDFVIGDEWKAGNLSYHLKSRPKWEGFLDNNKLDDAKEYICIDDICVGTYK